jgi:hypothetical protein
VRPTPRSAKIHDQRKVAAREAEICDAGFLPVAEIVADLDAYETWSQIGVRALFAPQSS